MIREKIVEIAYKYEGQKELKGNSGFENEFTQKELEAIGWKKFEAYCVLWQQLVVCKAYGHFDSTIINKLQKIYTKSATQTFYNFKKSREFKVKTYQDVESGDLVFWQKYINGEPDWRGHAAIVTRPAQLFFLTMEGNTSDSGGRDGDGFYEKKRDYDFYEENGLRLLGFVKPKEV